MADLILINGAPGSGKSTLAWLLAQDRPLTLALDIDSIKHSLGQWHSALPTSGLAARALAVVMASAHLRDGRDVIVSQYLARTDFIVELESLAQAEAARFREFILRVDERHVRERLASRAVNPGRPEHSINAELVGPDDAPRLVEAIRQLAEVRRTATVVDGSGGIPETLNLLRSHLLTSQA